MKDDRTPEQKYAAWVEAVTICHKNGWNNESNWLFWSPSGTLHDLSAADLSQLENIEKEGHFLVK